MQAIIMAAGKGTRLKHLSEETPKPLVTVSGKTLLGHKLDVLLNTSQITQIIVVTGHMNDKIEQFIKENYNSPKIKIIHNHQYHKGPILTAYAAKDLIHGSFMVCNADHLFSSKLYKRVCNETNSVLIGTFTNRQPAEDERKVVVDKKGDVSLPKKTETWHCGYTGLAVVDAKHKDQYFELARREIEAGNDSFHPDDLILPLSQSGVKIQFCNLDSHTFLEVDTPEEYEAAQTNIHKIWAEDRE